MTKKGEESPRGGAAPRSGSARLPEGERAFYDAFNREIPSLCDTLPERVRAEALVFYMRYAGIGPGDDLDFFRHYPAPAWSVVYWLTREHADAAPLAPDMERAAVTAHAMALSLHSLDDHLLDGQLPLTPLSLLLRSQAWMRMNQALERLAHGVQGGEETVARCLADYHQALAHPGEPGSLDDYCLRFRNEMAPGVVVPLLLALRRKPDPALLEALETGATAFGVVWRLLDDMQDLEQDARSGVRSAVYTLLPDEMKTAWDACAAGQAGEEPLRRVLRCVQENGILARLGARVEREMAAAVSLADRLAPRGMAEELRGLSGPGAAPGDGA